MKRLVVILIALIVAINVNAQENSQSEDLNARIDSLTTKLNQLQHDFDFLDCRYLIDKLANEIKGFGTDIEVRSHSISLDRVYLSPLYESYKRYYDATIETLNAQKSNVEQLKALLFLKLVTSNFTEKEQELLNSSMKLLDKALTSAEASLDLLKDALDGYKALE